MTHDVQAAVLLLLIAAVVAMLAQRLRLPYSAGLVASGIVLAFLPLPYTLTLTKDLIYTLLLPPLLFEAAYHLDWKQLRRNLPVIVTLATVGVLISMLITAAGLHLLGQWPWNSALVFGTLIAATDPVSVIATLKEAGAHGRLRLLLEAESLLNDGTAAVAFGMAVVFMQAGNFSVAAAAGMSLLSILGGVACGAAVAYLMLLLSGKVQDHLVETTLTAVAAYGSFLLADHFEMSGVLATISAGLVMRNLGNGNALTARGRQSIEDFWEYAAFLSNSIIFLLIGVHEAHQNFIGIWRMMLPAIAFVLLGRLVAIFPCSAIFHLSRLRMTAKHQVLMFWGGLRGALALALALGLPAGMPMREEILAATFATVAFSIFVQGLTMTPLLRKMGEIPK